MAKRRSVVVLLGGALSTTLLLGGCLGNPPSRTGTGGPPSATPVANADVEVRTISLGFVPILEAAPLVIGVEKGFFASHGLEVKLAKQSSWATARDNVVLGSAGGGIDGGQWQLPMPQMISEGALTNGAPLAWVPIALVLFQRNQPAAIFVIFITSIWPILINTAEGVRQIPQDYRNVAQVLQMSKGRFFSKVLIPSALPYIFTGLRISIGLAWLAIIAAEIVMPGTPGIGFFIWDANQNGYVSEIVLGVIWIGAIGLILDRLMAWLQKRISPGQ